MSVYLAHHGIKGQKWGRRRYQNEDGSLTPEGYDRYGIQKRKDSYKKAVSDARKAWLHADLDTYNKASAEVSYRKHELSDAKVRSKLDAQTKVSARQQKLIAKYKSDGFTQEEAEIAAYKRDKAEKIAKAALGVTVAALATYGAYKYADYAFDKKLTTRTTLSRVSKELHEGGDRGVFDAFYAVNDRSAHDKARYAGLYAQQMRQGVYGYVAPTVYEKKIGVDSAIKVASRKNAKEIVAKELLKGDNLSKLKADLGRAGAYGKYGHMDADIEKLKQTGKISGRLYDHINQHLVARDLDTTKMFYKALKDAGYGAVKDVNDAKYSGFRTKLPLIIFDSSKVSVKQVNALSDSSINKRAARVFFENSANDTLKEIAPIAAYYSSLAGITAGALSVGVSASESKIVSEYRQQHPNSKLSKNEIIRNYYAR